MKSGMIHRYAASLAAPGMNLVFDLFFALVVVGAIRGMSWHIWNMMGIFPAASRGASRFKTVEPELQPGALPLNQTA